MTKLALFADLDRCTGCQTCVVACKAEKHLPPGLAYIRLTQVGPVGDFPELSMYYLPIACQQCGRPSCAAACPEGAIAAGADGIVCIDSEKCTGCGDCVGACPYGAMVLDTTLALARKCDLCAELRAAGGQPACVAVCPARALAVIDVDSASGLAAASTAHILKLEAGTEPAGRFALTRQRWKGME